MKKIGGKRQRPKLGLSHEEISTEAIWNYEGSIEKVQFIGGQLPSFEDERMSFDDVIFKNVSFSGCEMRAAEFVDVVFQTCDFSNVKIGHTLFSACDGKYSNFSFAGMREVEFDENNLTDADFYECAFKEVRFLTCKMNDVNFSETELKGVDLSSNTYGRIEVTLPKIAGCIVSKEQAIGFARILGVTVKEN